MSRPSKWRRPLLAALCWSLICLAALVFCVSKLTSEPVKTDLYALLPPAQTSEQSALAREKSLNANLSDIVCLIQAPAQSRAEPIALTLKAWLEQNRDWIEPAPVTRFDAHDIGALSGLMTHTDEAALKIATTPELLSRVYQHASSLASLTGRSFDQDPLGLMSNKLKALSSLTPFHSENGLQTYTDAEHRYVLVPLQLRINVLTTDRDIAESFNELKRSVAASHANAQTFFTGTALFTYYAASQAQREFSWLGTLSALSVLALTLAWFKKISTLLQIALITGLSLIGATAGTLLVCGEIHLISLMFGTSLIGITVDYSAHYFSRRSQYHRGRALESLRGNLLLAFFTSCVAFGMLGITPMPGLRQMAIFCCVGLVFALVSVLVLLPILDYLSGLHHTLVPQKIVQTLNALPNLSALHQRSHLLTYTLAITIFTLGLGIFHLKMSDNLQDLNNFDPELILQAQQVARVTRAPAPSQYLIVRADSRESVLQIEERIQARLESAPDLGISLVTPTHWVASAARTQRLAALHDKLYRQLKSPLTELLGQSLPQPTLSYPTQEEFRLSDLGQYFEPTWVDSPEQTFRIVSLIGLNAQNKAAFRQLVAPIEGAQFVDFSQEIALTLQYYRDTALRFLAFALVLLTLVLTARFKRNAWRAALPVMGALVLTLGTLGWLSHPISLFTALALILLLGLGVDYGIFVTAGSQEKSALPAVVFAAVTTVLSFGLLALTSTPALQTFGLTLAIGQSWLMFLTLLLRQRTLA